MMNRTPAHHEINERLNAVFVTHKPNELADRFREARSYVECYNASMTGAYFRAPLSDDSVQTGIRELEGEELCPGELLHPFHSFATVLVYPIRPTTRQIRPEAIEMLGEPPAPVLEKLMHPIFSDGEVLAQDNFEWRFFTKLNCEPQNGKIGRTRAFYVFDNDAEPLEKEGTHLLVGHDGQTVSSAGRRKYTSSKTKQTSEVYKTGVAGAPTKKKRANNKYKNSRNGETVYVFVTVEDNETFDCAYLDFPLVGHHLTAAVMRKERGYSTVRSQVRSKALTFVFPIEKTNKPSKAALKRWGAGIIALRKRAIYDYMSGPMDRAGLRTPGYLKDKTDKTTMNDWYENHFVHCTVSPIINKEGEGDGGPYSAKILPHFRQGCFDEKPRAITIFLRTVFSPW